MVLILGNGVFVRFEYKPIRLIQITSPFPFFILCQLVVMSWQIPDVLESVCSIKISNSS